jgi:D-alanyl-D-alanine carboxypeptidase/D-alanyl-D-alanine-endopeptidase (penicillin-binding protein 4)
VGSPDHRLPGLGRERDEHGSVLRKLAYAVVVMLVVAGAVVVAVQRGWFPASDEGAAPPSAQPPSTSGEPVLGAGPSLDLSAPAPPPDVLGTAATNARVRPAVVSALLAGAVDDKSLGRHVGLVVEQLGHSKPVLAHADPGDVTPASTLKLLTATAALHLLGPGHRFSTRVVTGATRNSVVLVGGGDPLLTGTTLRGEEAQASYPRRASLQQLARATAAALKTDGIRRVNVGYDVSLYSGPKVNPTWEPTYLPENVVSPIVPLWVDEGRTVAGFAQRVPDPAATAALRFVRFLSRSGIVVVGTPVEERAKPSATTLAVVESAPLEQIVQHVLEVSDNEGAETLLRQAAIAAGRPGSFEAGVDVVRDELTDLGVPLGDAVFHDGSGLSRQDRLPIQVLAAVLQLAASGDHPELRSVVSTLPVAGFTGSLTYRFIDDAPAGLGVVRAKTATLTGVHGLAGIVTTRRGTPLVFALVADRVPVPLTLAARAQLDRIAALLATCPC